MTKKPSKKLLKKYRVSGDQVSYRDKETGQWISVKKAIEQKRKVRRETYHRREGRKPSVDYGAYKVYKKEWKNTQISYKDQWGKWATYSPFKLLQADVFIDGKRVWRTRLRRIGKGLKGVMEEYLKQQDVDIFISEVIEVTPEDKEEFEKELKEYGEMDEKERKAFERYMTDIELTDWRKYILGGGE